MKMRTYAVGGAVALVGLLSVTPVLAHTSQPSSPAEIRQTDDLNAQALANARAEPAPMPAPMTTATATTDKDDTSDEDTSADDAPAPATTP